MARQAKTTDYHVDVDGVGHFIFARRAMADEIALQVEFARILDGVEPTAWLQAVGGWISAFKVLTVKAPDGWDVDALDPLEPETYQKMQRVYNALVDKERSFRRQPGSGREGEGKEAVQVG